MTILITHKPSCTCEKCRPKFGRLDVNVRRYCLDKITKIDEILKEAKRCLKQGNEEYAIEELLALKIEIEKILLSINKNRCA